MLKKQKDQYTAILLSIHDIYIQLQFATRSIDSQVSCQSEYVYWYWLVHLSVGFYQNNSKTLLLMTCDVLSRHVTLTCTKIVSAIVPIIIDVQKLSLLMCIKNIIEMTPSNYLVRHIRSIGSDT